jgi:hypothetical protein
MAVSLSLVLSHESQVNRGGLPTLRCGNAFKMGSYAREPQHSEAVMNILDAILNHQDGAAVQQLAQQFGLDNTEATSALTALIPQLAAGVQNNMQQPGGLDSLLGALTGGSHDQVMSDPTMLAQSSTVDVGNGILGQILGSRDVSRQVAANAASQTGLSSDLMKQMLPLVATLVMGALSRQASAAGTSAGVQSSGLMGSLESMLDQNRDGSMVDDVVGMMGKFLGGSR